MVIFHYKANSDLNILPLQVSKVNIKDSKPVLKNLPPSNPSKAFLNLAPKKPPIPQALPNYAQAVKRRLSGDYDSANIYEPPKAAGNYMTPRDGGNRNPSPGFSRVPSAGNALVRRPLVNMRPYF